MGEKWYDHLPEDALKTEADRAYERAAAVMREGLDEGLGFDDASKRIDVADAETKARIIDDLLKVLIAEEHFGKKVSLEELAERLKVSGERLVKAKEEMFEDVEKSAVESFHRDLRAGE